MTKRSGMMGQMGNGVVMMKKPAVRCEAEGLREATSGRVVAMLPRVWAVGENRSVRELLPSTQAEPAGAAEEVAFYRKYTEALLRRYQRLYLQAGRVPSPMDRDVFRGRMSHYKVQGFDDAVIFCADVERCLGRLNAADQRLVQRIAVQEYTMGEAAGLLGMSLRSCIVLYRQALDRTTRLFLDARILTPQKSCQEGRAGGDELSC